VISPFNLEVRPGEIVGLAGLLGSGRTETAEVIFGIKPADSGSALIKGKPQTLRSPHQASCLGVGFCPEDRKTDGIIAAASVRENIILALQAQRGWLRPIPVKSKTPLPSALSVSWVSAPRARNSPSSSSPAVTSRRCCSPAGC
jgi:simple sugar transport system ATP-binding protein